MTHSNTSLTWYACLLAAGLAFTSCKKERFMNEPGNLVPKTVDQDPTLPAIAVNGAMLHSEAYGPADSTLIIAIHGGPGADYRYLLNCKDLADAGYRVAFYDQRGSGLSQRFSKERYTNRPMDLIYDELSGVIAHYRTRPAQKVVLLGHSWGAILATGYTGRYPGKVQGLILCEPGGLTWADITQYVKESRSFNFFGELLNDATYSDQFITVKGKDEHEVLDYKMALFASKNEITGEDNSAPGSFWRNGAVISDALFEYGEKNKIDFSEGIGNFRGPVLFFNSELNRAYPDSWMRKITAVYPVVHTETIAGVGHDGIISNDSQWAAATRPLIINYLKSL